MPVITRIYVNDLGKAFELVNGEWQERLRFTCIVCGKANDYWWMYCQEHEAQCDREMEND